MATRQLSVVNTIYKFTTAQAFVDVAANQSHLRRNLMGPGLRAQRSRCPPPAMMTCVNQGIVVSLPLQDIEKVKKEFRVPGKGAGAMSPAHVDILSSQNLLEEDTFDKVMGGLGYEELRTMEMEKVASSCCACGS